MQCLRSALSKYKDEEIIDEAVQTLQNFHQNMAKLKGD